MTDQMHHGRTIGVVALLVVVLTGTAGLAGAQSGSATPIDSCRTIADDGKYVLTSDVRAGNSVCVQILSSDVIFDGQGHTIRGANASGGVGVKVNNSLTSLSNVTVKNVSTTGWETGIYYRDVDNGTLKNVNASANRQQGILLRAAPNTTVRNVTAVDNGRWSLYATGNSTNVTGTDFETRSATISFVANDVALTGIARPPGGIPNRTALQASLGAAGTGPNASLRLGMNYANQTITKNNITENTIRLWVYDGNWTQVPGSVVTVDRNRVMANVSNLPNASTFVPAGKTPTPTPTPTSTATRTRTATATPTANAAATTGRTTSSSDGPGFGIGLALVGLFAAALLAFRR